MPKLTEGSYQPSELEHDAEFAHSVGNALNDLIDKGLITVEAVENAPPRKFTEFVRRYQGAIMYGTFDPKDYYKIFTLFPATEDINKHNREGERKETIDFGRNLLAKMQGKDERICGLLLFGSRLDPQKLPREESDLDAVPILLGSEIEYGPGKRPIRILQKVYKEEFPNASYPLGDWESELTSEELLDIVDHGLDPYNIPVWSWNNEAVYFVGKIGDLTEKEVNDRIQAYVQSPKLLERKQKAIDLIKQRVKGMHSK